MSSSATPGGATAAGAPQRYFCHQCDRTVTIAPSPTGDLSCPICHGGFVEEFDIPNPNSNRNPNPSLSLHAITDLFLSSSSSSSGVPFRFSSSSDLQNPNDLTGLFGGGPDRSSLFRSSSSPAGPEPFNPLAFLQNYFQTLMADGTNIQVVFEGAGGSPLTGNLGDYFIGPGLEQLIQQLAENDPNRLGTPPAAKSAVDTLPDVKISHDLPASDDEAECAVCKDAFEIGAEVKQMPCKHLYHKDCIIPWLKLHNSCPVCRYELPTDDLDYENRRRGAQGLAQVAEHTVAVGDLGGASMASAVAGGDGNSPGGTRTMERRFRISLPGSYRAMGSGAETSNTGDGGNNSGGSGAGRDGGSGGRGDLRSETRQEDLD